MEAKSLKPQQAPTITSDGKRRWIYPDRRSGLKARKRKGVAIALIVFNLTAPFLSVNGLPLIRADIETGLVTFCGQAFRFHDASYLAFIFVIAALLLFIITAVKGRIWCGYACPQTVWIDWVIRPIEEAIEGSAAKRQVSDRGPLTAKKAFKKVLKHSAFGLVALVLAHVLLAYFVAPSSLIKWLTQSPTLHWKIFLLVSATSAILYFDFAWFREQFCAFLCPYARFQAVMIDQFTPVVSYDKERGDPRGKKNSGACIDCELCKRVCPTGIDIRDGLQLECIHCSRCIDACDMIMTSLKRPLGLIREVSSEALTKGIKDELTSAFLKPRVALYCVFLAFMSSVFFYRVSTREVIELSITRQQGSTYSLLADGSIGNLFELKATNTSASQQSIFVKTKELEASVICSGCTQGLAPFETKRLSLLVSSKNKALGRVTLMIDKQELSLSLLAPK